MGMFDVLIFQEPIYCKCGQKIESTQTKLFDNALMRYRVGDLLREGPFLAVAQDEFYCDACSHREPLYIAINFQIYLGVYRDFLSAKSRDDSFDMMTLWQFYARKHTKEPWAFRESAEWFLRSLKKHLKKDPAEKSLPGLSNLYAHYFENSDDPAVMIERFLERNKTADTIMAHCGDRCEFEITHYRQDGRLFVANEKIQQVLERGYLFEIVSRGEDRESSDGVIFVHGEPTESAVIPAVQEWMDTHGLPLRVVQHSTDGIEAKEAFLTDMVALYRRYGYSLAHEDTQGAFKIEAYKDENIEWLMECLMFEKSRLERMKGLKP